MITRKKLIQNYLEFFKAKNHKVIPNSSLIPLNDSTTLFISAGMQPLVPYLLGKKHPLGKRLVNVQKCIRTTDIDEVGNETHHTFFEMLGNWSLGDYWKKEAIEMSFEFLTRKLKLPVERLAVTTFKTKGHTTDYESPKIWISLGIPKERIKALGEKDNWWPSPEIKATGPCGPDTEIFYWASKTKPPKKFNPKDKRWVEIWNDVFMQYNKDKRLILVDGMHCLYDKNFKINKELLETVNSFNSHYILVVNKFRERGRSLVKNYNMTRDTNWEAFSLEEKGIEKDTLEYFKTLLERFHLVPEEVMYFDHDKKNIETAKKLGILSKHYTDAKSIKKFIEENLQVFIPLKQKNVDTGMGVERTLAVLNKLDDNYLTEVFLPIIKKIEKLSGKKYQGNEKSMRIIADHIKAAVFIISDGIVPSNTSQGYVLRRLIRRAIVHGRKLELKDFTNKIAEPVFDIYKDYKELKQNKGKIIDELKKEEEKFLKKLEQGLKVLKKLVWKNIISGNNAFLLHQSYGFPIEITKELAAEWGANVNIKEFETELKKHQNLSRTASSRTFKSGLSDSSKETTKLHTANHLLNEALRRVLNKNIRQKGSNITPDRLRFDFNFPRKLTEEEIKKVEDLVNKKISEGLEVIREEMPLKKALKTGASSEFGARYPEIVRVYTIGDFSKEICTGPHVTNTREIGKFKIVKEESSAADVRRIKSVIE